MAHFFNALGNPDIIFLRYALLVGLLGSIAFGIIGTYVVTRRISYIAGAIAHSALGGIGAGLYIQIKIGVQWFSPVLGAVLSSLAAGIIIGVVSLYAKQREDTVIGAIWAKEAWGHYWTWDPKETWALLTWLCYLIYIHIRFQHRQSIKTPLWFLAGSFVVLLLCWFGVNYIPAAQTSIHTY